MSTSDEIQKNPGETSLSQARPPVQPTPESSTNPNTTNNNSNNSEVNNKKNNGGNSPATAENHTFKISNTTSNDNSNTTINNTNNEHGWCPGFWHLLNKDRSPMANSNLGAKSKQEENDESIKRRGDADKQRKKRSQHIKLKKKVEQIEKYINELVNFQESDCYKDMKNHLEKLQEIVRKSEEGIDNMDASSIAKTPAIKLPEVNEEIMKLMKHLSSPETMSKKVSLSAHLQSSSSSDGRIAVHELVNVHKHESFTKVSFYSGIQDIFCNLDKIQKLLLSCFTVFPENAVVKRRTLLYWVVGEGFFYSSSTENENMSGKIVGKFHYVFQEKPLLNASGNEEEEETPKKIVDAILKDFEEKSLIEPAMKKRKQPLHVKSYRMDPLVRSAVIKLVKDIK